MFPLIKKATSILSKLGIPIAISIGGLFSSISIALLLQKGIIPLLIISNNTELNYTFTMQLMILPFSIMALILTYFYNKVGFKTFFKVKGSNSKIVSNSPSWYVLGPILAIVFTFGSMMYMSIQVTSQHGQMNASFFKLIPWVILFAATNAWTEEIFSRFVIVSGLYGKASPDVICWISATIFGLGHIFGTPNGIFGVIVSGLLGWLLAKSVIETKGMGWAWFIHFLQDLIIFGAGAMIIAGHQ